MDLFFSCLPAWLGWIVKEFRGNLRKINLLTCKNIKEVKKKKDAWKCKNAVHIPTRILLFQKNRIKNIDFRKSNFSCFNSLETLSIQNNYLFNNIMSFIRSLENWEFSCHVEIIRKSLVLIIIMKKNGSWLKEMSLICRLLHSSVVLVSSVATCDLMQWNVSVMTADFCLFFLCLKPNIFQVLLSNLKRLYKN